MLKNSLLILFLLSFISCSMDNKSEPLILESIKKNNQDYIITVSTEVDLNAIKEKHNFTDQRLIGLLKKPLPENGDLKLLGTFETANQIKKGNRYYYSSQARIVSSSKDYLQLTDKDTLEIYLQLSYDMGRTYPTKSIVITAKDFQ